MAVKDAVLQALEQARGERLSGGRLAAQLGVSRAAVHKAIGALRSGGLAIDGVPGEGYRLSSEDDSLTTAGVAALLDTDCIGRDLLVVPSLTSTNTVLKERYLNHPHGFVLLAEEQTGGRGRLGRSFASPAGTGIYLTILLHPTLPIQHIQFITIAAAVAVAEAIGQTAGFDPQIKWVNDVLMDGRKLCGILTEAMIEGETGTVSSLIAGIGVNLRPTLHGRTRCALWRVRSANSARCRAARSWPPPSCRALSAPIPCSSRDSRPSCSRANRSRLCCIGREITVIGPAAKYEALCTGLDENGHLLVRDKSGQEHTLSSGEISIRF